MKVIFFNLSNHSGYQKGPKKKKKKKGYPFSLLNDTHIFFRESLWKGLFCHLKHRTVVLGICHLNIGPYRREKGLFFNGNF